MIQTASHSSLTRADLLRSFLGTPDRAGWMVGGEFERHVLDPRGMPLPYEGQPGIRSLFEELGRTRAFTPYLEAGNPIALDGDGSVTLEPGGQLELSGSPYRRLDDVAAQALRFADMVDEVLADTGYRQVAVGFTPWARIVDIPWVPKGRYVVMREYLARTGELAHHMMKGTCAVQASYDFSTEQDCARKVTLAIRLAPLTTALFANSPLAEGKPTGFASFRGHIWTRTDPARTGLPDAADDFGFERWLDYLLDVPMMFVRDEHAWVNAHGATFRDWLQGRALTRPPTQADWDLHLTSVFPEVRVKRQIEVRGADCVPFPLSMAFAALFQGLFYDEASLDGALDIAAELAQHGTREDRFAVACRDGLRGEIGGSSLLSRAERIVDLARGGLERLDVGESRWLAPLVQQVQTGASPADSLLRAWERDPRPAALLPLLDWRG